MLCCNDHRSGVFLGYAEAVEVQEVSLVGGRVSVNYEMKKLARAQTVEGDHTLRIGRIRVPALGYKTWVGNWCWDLVHVRAVHALTILNYLASKSDWHCEEAECSIFEAFNDRRLVTPEEWKKYVTGGAVEAGKAK